MCWSTDRFPKMLVKAINPLLPSVPYTFIENFDRNLRRNHQKNSYELSDYESVDEKSLS